MGRPLKGKTANFDLRFVSLLRLTNAFSKKAENLKAAVALWFAYYNFCRIHGSLRITPCMQAGITDWVWELKDIAA
jgi:hypothetical protein